MRPKFFKYYFYFPKSTNKHRMVDNKKGNKNKFPEVVEVKKSSFIGFQSSSHISSKGNFYSLVSR